MYFYSESFSSILEQNVWFPSKLYVFLIWVVSCDSGRDTGEFSDFSLAAFLFSKEIKNLPPVVAGFNAGCCPEWDSKIICILFSLNKHIFYHRSSCLKRSSEQRVFVSVALQRSSDHWQMSTVHFLGHLLWLALHIYIAYSGVEYDIFQLFALIVLKLVISDTSLQ